MTGGLAQDEKRALEMTAMMERATTAEATVARLQDRLDQVGMPDAEESLTNRPLREVQKQAGCFDPIGALPNVPVLKTLADTIENANANIQQLPSQLAQMEDVTVLKIDLVCFGVCLWKALHPVGVQACCVRCGVRGVRAPGVCVARGVRGCVCACARPQHAPTVALPHATDDPCRRRRLVDAAAAHATAAHPHASVHATARGLAAAVASTTGDAALIGLVATAASLHRLAARGIARDGAPCAGGGAAEPGPGRRPGCAATHPLEAQVARHTRLPASQRRIRHAGGVAGGVTGGVGGRRLNGAAREDVTGTPRRLCSGERRSSDGVCGAAWPVAVATE